MEQAKVPLFGEKTDQRYELFIRQFDISHGKVVALRVLARRLALLVLP